MELDSSNEASHSMISILDSCTSSDCGDGSIGTTITKNNTKKTAFLAQSNKKSEEEFTTLQKENFNLKLRIYFLEEKLGTSFSLKKENVLKKYTELQENYVSLKEDLEEKKDLLSQSAKVKELNDKEHKRYLAEKDNQVVIIRQEIEDLKNQLHDTRFLHIGDLFKSDTSGYCSNSASNNMIFESEQKIKQIEQELQIEKDNNASLQFVVGKINTLNRLYENMEKEFQAKEAILETLKTENTALNARLSTCAFQINNTQERFKLTCQENKKITTNIILEQRKFDELVSQYEELYNKYKCIKADVEKEKQELESVKLGDNKQICKLESENSKLRSKLYSVQLKLDAAITEIRKNQNLALRTQQHLQEIRKRTHYMYK